MSIQAQLQELKGISAELRNLNIKRKKLKEREKDIANKVSDFLKSKDQPGLKYNGEAFVVEEKETRMYKKQKDKDASAIEVLKDLNIDSPEKVLTKILEAMKGDTIVKEKLKIKKIKS